MPEGGGSRQETPGKRKGRGGGPQQKRPSLVTYGETAALPGNPGMPKPDPTPGQVSIKTLERMELPERLSVMEQEGHLSILGKVSGKQVSRKKMTAFNKMSTPSKELCDVLATEKSPENITTAIKLEGKRIGGKVVLANDDIRYAIHYLIANESATYQNAAMLCDSIRAARTSAGPAAKDVAKFTIVNPDPTEPDSTVKITALKLAVHEEVPKVVAALCDDYETWILSTPGIESTNFSTDPREWTPRDRKFVVRINGTIPTTEGGELTYEFSGLYLALVQPMRAGDEQHHYGRLTKSAECAAVLAGSRIYSEEVRSIICQKAIEKITEKRMGIFTDYGRLGVAIAHLDPRSGLSVITHRNTIDRLAEWMLKGSIGTGIERSGSALDVRIDNLVHAAFKGVDSHRFDKPYLPYYYFPGGLWWFVHGLIKILVQTGHHLPKLDRDKDSSGQSQKRSQGERVEQFVLRILHATYSAIGADTEEGTFDTEPPLVDEGPGYDVLLAAMLSRSKVIFNAVMKFYPGLDLSTVKQLDDVQDYTGINRALQIGQDVFRGQPQTQDAVFTLAVEQAGEDGSREVVERLPSERPVLKGRTTSAKPPAGPSGSLAALMDLTDGRGKTLAQYLKWTPAEGASTDGAKAEKSREARLARIKARDEVRERAEERRDRKRARNRAAAYEAKLLAKIKGNEDLNEGEMAVVAEKRQNVIEKLQSGKALTHDESLILTVTLRK